MYYLYILFKKYYFRTDKIFYIWFILFNIIKFIHFIKKKLKIRKFFFYYKLFTFHLIYIKTAELITILIIIKIKNCLKNNANI